ARRSERPWWRSDSLTCSYWRARFVPFLIPRGGTAASFRYSGDYPAGRPAYTSSERKEGADGRQARGEEDRDPRHRWGRAGGADRAAQGGRAGGRHRRAAVAREGRVPGLRAPR